MFMNNPMTGHMSKKIRLGFVGAGKQAQTAHLRYYSTLPDCELVAIADVDTELAGKVAQRFGIGRVESSHTALIEKGGVDACVAVLPGIPSSEGVVTDFLKAGIPLLTEKPLASSPEAAARIAAVARETGSFLRVGFHKRSDPATLAAVREIRRFQASGELGKLTYVRIHVCLSGDWIAGGHFDGIRGNAAFPATKFPEGDFPGMNEKARGLFGMFSGGNGHQFDWMRHLWNESFQVVEADPSQVLLVVRSASGIPGVFEFTPYHSTRDWIENAMVCFEKGYVKVELPPPLSINRPGSVEVFRNGAPEETATRITHVLPFEGAMKRQAELFLAAVRGEKNDLCDAGQALESVEIAREFAIRVSS
jgi:predicted dehydrogenase